MQDESGTENKNIVEDVVQKWLVFTRFIREKLEQGREFRSEDLQKNNERQARKRQYNQLIIQNKQMQALQSQAVQALQQ